MVLKRTDCLMLASLQSQRILARNGGNYVGERLHAGLPGSAPHVFIQIGRDKIPLDSEVSLKFSLTGIPPALNVVGMYTRQRVDVGLAVVDCLVWVAKCSQTVVSCPLIGPYGGARQDIALD